MTRRTKVIAGVGAAVILGLAALSLVDSGSGSDLPPAFRSGIDQLEAAKDCAALQSRFDGVHDADYLKYIDDAMRDAGCYD